MGTGKLGGGHKPQTATAMPINNKRDGCGFGELTGPHKSGPNIYPITNNEIINVPTVSESSNLSAMDSIAPAGADDANVVLNTKAPANIVKYHFLAFERF